MNKFKKLRLSISDQGLLKGGFLGIGRDRQVDYSDVNGDGIIDKVVTITNSKTGKWIKSTVHFG